MKTLSSAIEKRTRSPAKLLHYGNLSRTPGVFLFARLKMGILSELSRVVSRGFTAAYRTLSTVAACPSPSTESIRACSLASCAYRNFLSTWEVKTNSAQRKCKSPKRSTPGDCFRNLPGGIPTPVGSFGDVLTLVTFFSKVAKK